MKRGYLDISRAFRNFHVAFLYAWGDTKARYKRSYLGPLWIVLTTILSVTGLGYIWSILLNLEIAKFVPSLTIGLVIWQLISTCVLEAPSIFIRHMSFIKNVSVPYSMFPLYLITRQLIYFFHAFIVIVVVLLIYSNTFSIIQLMFIPNILLLFFNLFWIVLLFACIGIKYRDFEQIVSGLMPMLFFLSPVIYRPSELKFAELFAWFNPFTYLITLLRDPLLGLQTENFVYVVSFSALLIGGSFTLWYFSKLKSQIPFL